MRNLLLIFGTILFALGGVAGQAAETLGLSGAWQFALDGNDTGIRENWAAAKLPDKIQLPGALQSQDYGDEISTNTPWVLSLYDKSWFLRADYTNYAQPGAVKVPFLCQPPRHYLGAAWYQRDLEIPWDWNGRRVALFLERPHWKSTVWLDDREIGWDMSLCTPHEYDFGLVSPGKHRLTIRVDNRMLLPYRPDAHSVSDSVGDTWNGIVGKIELRASDSVCLERLRLDPDCKHQGVVATLFTRNGTGAPAGAALLTLQVVPQNFAANAFKPWQQSAVIAPGETNLTVFFPMGEHFEEWSEFNPKVYRLRATLAGQGFHSQIAGTFGMREIHTDGTQFMLNDRPLYLRGTHFGGDFPRTGYPPTDLASWKKIMQTCQDYGLNHMRFHSWCPPDAAFAAADELGFYLQVEPGMWNSFSSGGEMESQLYSETESIIRAYGNHPSFLLLSASNEAHGPWQAVLSKWVKHFRAADSRRLYTPDTGWSLINTPDESLKGGADYLDVGRIGPRYVRGEKGWFGRDYRRAIAGVNVPVVAHEVGQWCAYPDFEVIKKFTGYLRPANFEIFRDSAAANGVGDRDKDFAFASGRFQLACYKEEIEANLRTPGLAGFQLLDLRDYTGQGTALVGLLDPFWENKGYCPPDEFKKFCNTVVPLARLSRRVFTTADKFAVPVEAANFGAAPIADAQMAWAIQDRAGTTVLQGAGAPKDVLVGKGYDLGTISADLSKLAAPGQYRLVVSVGPQPLKSFGSLPPYFRNDWNFWLYPAHVSADAPTDVLVTSSWDDAEKKLAAGGKVLFLPRPADLDWRSPTLDEVPVFWNRLMSPQWSRMLGLWCDTNHPALAGFPTDVNCDWQWTQIVNHARTMNLARLPRGLQPIVSAIDDWNRNWKLGVVFEAKVGAGRLMVCTVDLKTDLDARPVARQLRRSLWDYMASEKFQPKMGVAAADFRSSLFDTLVMKKLGAKASGGGTADLAMDGDPNTFWQSERGGGGKDTDTHQRPPELVFGFTNAVAMDGVILMPRQNDRDHLGDARGFRIDTSNDGTNWSQVATGELTSSWNPQTIHFAHTITARQLKFTALSGFGHDTSAALAELAVIYAGPKLPENTDDLGQYKRVRSTSSDVDEGGAR